MFSAQMLFGKAFRIAKTIDQLRTYLSRLIPMHPPLGFRGPGLTTKIDLSTKAITP